MNAESEKYQCTNILLRVTRWLSNAPKNQNRKGKLVTGEQDQHSSCSWFGTGLYWKSTNSWRFEEFTLLALYTKPWVSDAHNPTMQSHAATIGLTLVLAGHGDRHVILALGKQKQGNKKSKVILIYIADWRIAWATRDPVETKQNKQNTLPCFQKVKD